MEVSRLESLTAVAALASLDCYDFSVAAVISYKIFLSFYLQSFVPRHIEGMGCFSVVLNSSCAFGRREARWRGMMFECSRVSSTTSTNCGN